METATSLVIGQFSEYLRDLTRRLDPGTGWYGEFLRRDPEGVRACLDGAAIPPWDVVESLLYDLAEARGGECAARETVYAAELRAAAVAAWDRLPGGERELRSLLVAAAARRADTEADLRRLTASLGADALAGEVSWARDDAARAAARYEDLAARLAALPVAPRPRPYAGVPPQRAVEEEAPERRPRGARRAGGARYAGPAEPGAGSVDRPHPAAPPPTSQEPALPAPRGARFGGLEGECSGLAEAAGERGREGGLEGVAAALPPPRGARFGGLEAPSGPVDSGGGAGPEAGPSAAPGARLGRRGASGGPGLGGDRPQSGAEGRTPTGWPAEAAPSGPPGARFGRRGASGGPGLGGDRSQAPAGWPAGAAPGDVRAAPAAPGGQRADAPPPPPAAAPPPTRAVVGQLLALRAQGRTGEAHVLLCEAAAWPAEWLPGLAAELTRAGLAADWATLLWEAASLPPDRLAAAAAALGESGRAADSERLLRQSVSRPATEIADAALALGAAGRAREADALLGAFVQVRTAEEAALLARRDPRWFAPRLLRAARALSATRHRDLVHALRVAGIAAA